MFIQSQKHMSSVKSENGKNAHTLFHLWSYSLWFHPSPPHPPLIQTWSLSDCFKPLQALLFALGIKPKFPVTAPSTLMVCSGPSPPPAAGALLELRSVLNILCLLMPCSLPNSPVQTMCVCPDTLGMLHGARVTSYKTLCIPL